MKYTVLSLTESPNEAPAGDADLQRAIDEFARQIAQIATNGATRAPLAELERRLQTATIEALREVGLSMKVIADMYGFSNASSLRRRMRQNSSRIGMRRTPLSECIVETLEEGPMTRERLTSRFHGRDRRMLRGVLRDLIARGVVLEAERSAHDERRPM